MKKLPFLVLTVFGLGASAPLYAAETRFTPPDSSQTAPQPNALQEAPAQAEPAADADDSTAETDRLTPNLLADVDLWERMRMGFSIPNLDSPQVREYEQYYANRPESLYRMVERAQRYLYHIVNELERRGMPVDLALLPMIESAFNPKAYSPAHAAGIWQFVPSTGKNYGLEQTWWYDGRRDVLAATDAALDYLQYLYGLFGDWHLALAAYNWGEGAVSRALAKNRASGLPEDYLNIRMPAETQNYVPKLLAVRNIFANPKAYGINVRSIPNRPYFTVVSAPVHMDTKVAAKLAEIPVDEFVHLNPAFNKPVIAYKPSRKLLIPTDKADAFNENLASYDKPLLSWKPYSTARGERYEQIAAKFGISVDRLREINSIGHVRVARGEMLLVPSTGADEDATQNVAAPQPAVPTLPTYAKLERIDSNPGTYKVKHGDTAFSVAKRYQLTVAELSHLNKLRAGHITPGQMLVVAKPDTVKPTKPAEARSGKQAVHKATQPKTTRYVVQRGDTVYSIARKFNVAAADIQRWNKLGKHLNPGLKVTLYLPDNS